MVFVCLGFFRSLVLCCLFVCFSFKECVVFPSKCPAEKLSETSLCQLEAQLKTRIYSKLLPTETALRCLYCCVCRMSCWAATYYLDNTFLQQYASLQEAFGTSSEQYLGTRAKSHHCGPWGPLRQLCFQHRAQSGGTALTNNYGVIVPAVHVAKCSSLGMSHTYPLLLLRRWRCCWLRKAVCCSLHSSLQCPGQHLAGCWWIFPLGVNFLRHAYKPSGIYMLLFMHSFWQSKWKCVAGALG